MNVLTYLFRNDDLQRNNFEYSESFCISDEVDQESLENQERNIKITKAPKRILSTNKNIVKASNK